MILNQDFAIEILQDVGLITSSDVESARSERRGKEGLIEVIIRMGIVSEDDVIRAVAANSGMEFIDLAHTLVSPEAVAGLSQEIAVRYKIAPVAIADGHLTIAVSDPLDFQTLDDIRYLIEDEIDFVCATPSAIKDALTQLYDVTFEEEQRVTTAGVGEGLEVISSQDEGEVEGDDAPIIKMVNSILLDAFMARASDIHIEPTEQGFRTRYRIDGVLHVIQEYPQKLHSAIVSRVKIMTGTMSIAEKRLPQDGRIQVKMKDRELDLRVSTIPTNHGESIVMRILDKSSLSLGLTELGFFNDDKETFEKFITLPDGILLVTGPTGSGKTTTLYACLNHINKPDRKIITVEDPVEYQLTGVNQVQVKEEIGMSFAAALRSILRQAPNIIMIGEIRDLETATIAINASLTGHLVFSTLHTNDAPSAVARLVNIGIKSFLIASSVRAIMAQRLVRKLCPQCAQSAVLTESEMQRLGIDPSQLIEADIRQPCGCNQCRQTGYRGRMGIFEIFKIDDEVRHMINENLSTPALRHRARELGMRTLREDGVRKVLAGVTTAGEVITTTMSDSN